MTKEELKQEAEEWLSITDNHLNDERTHFLSESEYAERAYLASAEPREKRIAELEKENKKLEEDFRVCEKNADTYYDQLTKAKEIIKDLLRLPYANDWEVYGDVTSYLDKAEQFLKEIEK